MGKCSKDKMFVCITLDKEIVKTLDGVLGVLNKEVDTSKGEKKFTRSMLIQDCLINLFEVGAKLKIEKTKAKEKEA